VGHAGILGADLIPAGAPDSARAFRNQSRLTQE